MFESFFDYYHYLLSKFSPINNSTIKRMLDEAAFLYNEKKQNQFIRELRSIEDYLTKIERTAEAATTHNYIQLLIFKNKNK